MYDVINSCTSLGPGSQKTPDEQYISVQECKTSTDKCQIPHCKQLEGNMQDFNRVSKRIAIVIWK